MWLFAFLYNCVQRADNACVCDTGFYSNKNKIGKTGGNKRFCNVFAFRLPALSFGLFVQYSGLYSRVGNIPVDIFLCKPDFTGFDAFCRIFDFQKEIQGKSRVSYMHSCIRTRKYRFFRSSAVTGAVTRISECDCFFCGVYCRYEPYFMDALVRFTDRR